MSSALLEKAAVRETSDDLIAGLVVVASAPAGWYAIDDDTRRWFDGRRWTDHYAPVLRLVPDREQTAARSGTNHGFHAIMVIMTLGTWTPVWAALAARDLIRSHPVRARLDSNPR